MNIDTRGRLIIAGTQLFAENGYRGASVRDICNLAGANPGAVSYHFGGKHQLYRTVLRRAATQLAEMGPTADDNPTQPVNGGIPGVIRRILGRIETDGTAARLLLRDLTDGGTVAVESLAPPLRSAFDALATAIGHDDIPRRSTEERLLFLELAAPLFLLTAAWPVVARAFGLEPSQRESLVEEMTRRTLEAHGLTE